MSKHREDCAFTGYTGHELDEGWHHIMRNMMYFHPCDCGYDPRPEEYWDWWPRKVSFADWSGFAVIYKPCRVCHAQTNNNFDLCPKDCMNIYSAWKTLGIVPEHIRIS